jgi:hypothetical protein
MVRISSKTPILAIDENSDLTARDLPSVRKLTADGKARLPRSPYAFLGPLYRYRLSGNLVLSAGLVGGMIAYSLALSSPWIGFAALALPVSIATSIIQAKEDARRSADTAAHSG